MSIEEEVRQLLEGLPEFLDGPGGSRVVVQLTVSDPESGTPVGMILMVARDPQAALAVLKTTAEVIQRGAENNWR